MVEGKIKVLNVLGLHARAATEVVRTASRFESDVWLSNSSREVNAKSIMGVMMLAATQGTTLKLRTDGADEHDAFAAMEDIFQKRFGEDE